jgi:hypothetical protein
VAVERLTGLAVRAATAVVKAEADAISFRETPHAVPDPLHDAGALMAEDSRERRREAPFTDRQIRVADPGGLDLDDDLVRPRLV